MSFEMDGDILRGYSGSTYGTIEIPQDTRYIGCGAFCGSDIKEIDLSTSWGLWKIMNNAFEGCYRLKRVIMNSSVYEIEHNAFALCSILEDIELPSDIEKISCRTFLNCYKLNSIEIPFGVKKIEESAFSGSGLTSIEIPSSVEEIGSNAFYGCPLEVAYIPSNLEIDIDDVFYCAGPGRGREKVKIVRV